VYTLFEIFIIIFVRERAIANYDGTGIYADSIKEAVWQGFLWRNTIEGIEYWQAFFDGKTPTLPLPTFRSTLTARITELTAQHATLPVGSHNAAHLWDLRCEVVRILEEWDKREGI